MSRMYRPAMRVESTSVVSDTGANRIPSDPADTVPSAVAYFQPAGRRTEAW